MFRMGGLNKQGNTLSRVAIRGEGGMERNGHWLKAVDLITDMKCELCGSKDENIEHLFFKCAFSQACLTNIMKWLQVNIVQQDINGLWNRIARKAAGKVSKTFLWTITTSIIYHIWGAINDMEVMLLLLLWIRICWLLDQKKIAQTQA